jgi:O-antigen/teichoic acid export membrane protein
MGDKIRAFSALRSAFELQTVVILGFIFLALFWRPTVTAQFLDSQSNLFWLLLFAVVVQLYYILFSSVAKGLRQLRYFALRQFLQAALRFGLTLVILVFLGFGIIGAIGINITVWSILTVMMFGLTVSVIQQGRLQYTTNRLTSQILHFSGMATLSNFFVLFVNTSGPLLIKTFQGQQANVYAGLFAVIFSWGRLLDVVLNILVKSGYPFISRWYAQKRFNLLRKYLLQLSLATVGGYLILFIFGLIFAHPLIQFIYGSEYLPTADYVGAAIVMFCSLSLSFVYRGALSGIGQMKALTFITFLGLSVFSGAFWIFYQVYEIDIILALLLAMLLGNTIQVISSIWRLNLVLQ